MLDSKVIVYGGGFSGLVTAYYLTKANIKCEVREAATRWGGLIQSPQHTFGIYETAANGMLNSPLVSELFQDLEIPLKPLPKASRRRFIFKKKPSRWPLGLKESFRLVRGLYRAKHRNEAQPREFETVKEWSERVLSTTIYQDLLAPALQGVYAGDAAQLSASLIIKPILFRKRSSIKPPGTVVPEAGMGELIARLVSYLARQNVELKNACLTRPLKSLQERVVLSVPAPAAADLLQEVAPQVSAGLKNISYLPLVSAQLFFAKDERPLTGFGCLFSRESGIKSLGVVFDHVLFPERVAQSSERWILGGAFCPEAVHWSDEKIVEQILKDRRALGTTVQPLDYVLTRWPQALPHYTVELEKTLTELKWPESLALVSNYAGGIGLSQIVERAHALAKKWS